MGTIKIGFRKKNDQHEVDTLREAVRLLKSVDVPKETEKVLVGSICFSIDEFFASFNRQEASKNIKKYSALLNLLQLDKWGQDFYSSLLNYRLSEVSVSAGIELFNSSFDVNKKIAAVESIIELLRSYLDNPSEATWNDFVRRDESLRLHLTARERNFLVTFDADTFFKQMQYFGNNIKSRLVVAIVRIFRFLVVDRRQSFRDKVRLLFKNMDDNSGDDAAFSLERVVSNYPKNYYTHEFSKRVSESYRGSVGYRAYAQ